MEGVQFVKNSNGENTHLLIDWQLHEQSIKTFLEDLADIEAMKKVENEESISFNEVRKTLIEKGVDAGELKDINV